MQTKNKKAFSGHPFINPEKRMLAPPSEEIFISAHPAFYHSPIILNTSYMATVGVRYFNSTMVWRISSVSTADMRSATVRNNRRNGCPAVYVSYRSATPHPHHRHSLRATLCTAPRYQQDCGIPHDTGPHAAPSRETARKLSATDNSGE